MPNATIISPDQLNPVGDANPYDFGSASKFLAQGDSWFSIGAVPFWSTSNLLSQLVLPEDTVIVNCAYPGRELAHMVDTTIDTKFISLLNGKMSYKWNAILLSAGGNDLIDVLNPSPKVLAVAPILLTENEWGDAGKGPARYVSDYGWANFSRNFNAALDRFLAVRDSGQNINTPVIMHSYDYPTPRPAPAGPGMGPWLEPALTAYNIPSKDWDILAKHLIDGLGDLLKQSVKDRSARGLMLVETRGTLTPADDNTKGRSGDWENEIHPTASGYAKLAKRWAPTLQPLL